VSAQPVEPLWTVGEVAARCSVSKQTVRRAEKAGDLKAVRLSPQVVRYLPEDVEDWIKRSRR